MPGSLKGFNIFPVTGHVYIIIFVCNDLSLRQFKSFKIKIMKKRLLAILCVLTGFTLLAQNPRMSLFEEFTGETCPPCAATNPGLDAFLKSGTNPSKIIPIKWQVPIPSAPSPTWSLYKTNQAEINWRFQTYGYGISSAPSCRIDGQMPTVFGMQSEHPGYLNSTVVANSSSVTTPFSITMSRAWNATGTGVTLTVTIASAANFAAVGNLVCRVVLIENEIHFPVAPGTNGEKDFNWIVRKSYPTIQNGTALSANWTNGQTQTFTLNCILPTYINDAAEVAFVAFIQDDGNRTVWQAAKADVQPFQNDAQALAIAVNSVVCSNTVSAAAEVVNNGQNAISAMTLTPVFDGVAGTAVTWSGNLAAGASVSIPLGMSSVTSGGHSYSVNINAINLGDNYIYNNGAYGSFIVADTYQSQQVLEDFAGNVFPPAKWGLYNPSGSTTNWVRSTNAGGQNSLESAKLDLRNITTGKIMDLVLPPINLVGTENPLLSFDVAYAQYNASSADRLQVLISTDCGATWTSVYDKQGAILATRGAITSAFTPSGDSQWRNEMVELVGMGTAATVIAKFRGISSNGNNMYVDNVNLMQANPTALAENTTLLGEVTLFPNPSGSLTTLRVNAGQASRARLTVTNTLGQIMQDKQVDLLGGQNSISIDATSWSAGVYNVVIESASGKQVRKLTVQH